MYVCVCVYKYCFCLLSKELAFLSLDCQVCARMCSLTIECVLSLYSPKSKPLCCSLGKQSGGGGGGGRRRRRLNNTKKLLFKANAVSKEEVVAVMVQSK